MERPGTNAADRKDDTQSGVGTVLKDKKQDRYGARDELFSHSECID